MTGSQYNLSRHSVDNSVCCQPGDRTPADGGPGVQFVALCQQGAHVKDQAQADK